MTGSPYFLARLAHGNQNQVGIRLSNSLDDGASPFFAEISICHARDLDVGIALSSLTRCGFGNAWCCSKEVNAKGFIRRREEARDEVRAVQILEEGRAEKTSARQVEPDAIIQNGCASERFSELGARACEIDRMGIAKSEHRWLPAGRFLKDARGRRFSIENTDIYLSYSARRSSQNPCVDIFKKVRGSFPAESRHLARDLGPGEIRSKSGERSFELFEAVVPCRRIREIDDEAET